MNAPTMGYRVSRALTAEEMNLIVGNARRASTTGRLLTGIVADLYNALLGDERRSIAEVAVHRPPRPSEYAIPTTQWEAIIREAISRAAEWGTSVEIGLELINVKPDTYDDPQAAVPLADTTDHRPSVLTLRVTRDAVDTIAGVDQYLGALASVYGRDSGVYRTACDSWLRQLPALFGLGMGANTMVRRDGGPDSLSLVVETASGVVFGIVFHRHRRYCAIPGCRATLGDDGTVRDLDEHTPAADHVHWPSYPVGAPAPGEWVAHS